ncbi:hydantoinase/carbamoylase family amidase [Poseidonocella sp. HB161398]|uniref:hydantoinase/carbamoylase family amidase n=1 Tax=Poseidonocella sp. HB161398 TaxID=2320855 RepID=UPI001108AB17|nr:hydantoinase/carbamoylase family amidase [Poseidonocella sp. HB161398]
MTDLPKRPDLQVAQAFLAELAKIRDVDGGVRRDSYGEGENRAHRIFRETAVSLGATWRQDAACNSYARIEGQDPSRQLIIGSHLDSVPTGGNFDGAAGVALGLAVLGGFIASDTRPPVSITVMAIRAEESTWFNASYIGSRAALGVLAPEELTQVVRADSGQSLGDAIVESGGTLAPLVRRAPQIDLGSITGFIEPHIEQGPALIAENMPVAAVTGIRGSFRYRSARCLGAYAHSGATPRDVRQDSIAATARLVATMDELWEHLENEGHDLTVTFGRFESDPRHHAFSKVAGEASFCLDVRSASDDTLERVHADLLRLVSEIESSHRVRFDLGERTGSDPAVLSTELVQGLTEAARASGAPCHLMASGAGHDAAAFCAAAVPSAMLFIRNRNGSHNPDEHMSEADFNIAAEVLLAFCKRHHG